MGLAGTQQNPSPATNQPLSPQGSWGGKGTQRTKQGQATLYYWLGLALGSEQNSSKNSWAMPSQLERAEHEGPSWTFTASDKSQPPPWHMRQKASRELGWRTPWSEWSKPRPSPQIPSSQGRGSKCTGEKDQERMKGQRDKRTKRWKKTARPSPREHRPQAKWLCTSWVDFHLKEPTGQEQSCLLAPK